MKAMIQTRYGGPERVSLADRPRPAVGPRDVLVAVQASPVTAGDRRLSTGDYPGITWLPGRIATGLTGPRAPVSGTVFAGTVVEVGPAVRRFVPGDAVFGQVMSGAHAELLCVPEDGAVARAPAGWEPHEAAALPYGAGTAHHFLSGVGGLAAGERVLVIGAAGGVGLYAVQLAASLGAEVTALARPADHASLRGLGAHRTLDPRDGAWREERARYDLVFDPVGALDGGPWRRLLAPQGRYLSLILSMRLLLAMALGRILPGPRAHTGVALASAERLDALRALAEAGAVRPVIDRVFPLDAAAEAHRHVATGQGRGTVMLQVGAPSRLRAAG